MSRYAEAALQKEFDKLASAQPGNQDNTINEVFFALAGMVKGGWFSEHGVKSQAFAIIQALPLSGKPFTIHYCETKWRNAMRASQARAPLDGEHKSQRHYANRHGGATNGPEYPKASLSGSESIPLWTPPDIEGKPVFIRETVSGHPLQKQTGEIRRHIYIDALGRPLRIKIKFEKQNGKSSWADWYYVQNRRAKGWQAKRPSGYVQIPYFLQNGINPFDREFRGILKFATEGEKDTENLARAGACAFSFGGSSTLIDFSNLAAGEPVVILGDDDAAGRRWANRQASIVAHACASIKVYTFPDLTEGDDASDFLEKHSLAELERIIAQLPNWVPAADREPGAKSYARANPGSNNGSGAHRSLWPDPEPLPDGLPPVEQFDFDLLPEMVRPWAEDITQAMQAPPDFVAIAIMTGLGSIIGRKLCIRPKAQDNRWTEVANLWGLGIGRPGILKTPSIDAALAPIKRLEKIAFDHYRKAAGERETVAKIAKLREGERKKAAKQKLKNDLNAELSDYFEPGEMEEPPKLRRYMTNDSSPAALGALHVDQTNGLLVHRDEVVSLLQSLDREENAEGRGFYLTGWGGNSPWTIDRIGRGLNHYIPAVCLSVLGSTQPGKIARYVSIAKRGGMGDDGMLQRFSLAVWPDVDPNWENVDRPLNAEAKKKAFAVYQRLDGLDPRAIGAKQDIGFDDEPDGIPYFRFDEEAQEIFRDWHARLEHRLRSGELHPAMESHLGKYRKLAPSLALICHVADQGEGPVAADALLRALAWAQYLESHARRLYAAVISPEADLAKAILAKIKEGTLGTADNSGIKSFTARDIARKEWSRLSDKEEVRRALDLLVDYGWLNEEKLETGGRPCITYIVNPGAKL